MYRGIPFTETQKFLPPKFLWIYVLGAVAFLSAAILSAPNIIFLVGMLAGGVNFAVLYWTRLDTTIDQTGVTIQFVPFHRKPKHYPWDEITRAYVRKYNPIFEYGGWGMRDSFIMKNKAFNVSGDRGLQLEFANGQKLLIGTQLPAEVEEMLKSLGKGW